MVYWLGKGDQTVATHGGTATSTTAANPKPVICPYTEPKVNLKRGSKGTGVKWIQYHLNRKSYGLKVDGDFGTKTDTAVKAFQKKMCPPIDGIVGAKTRAKLKG